jgi:hypothetical protein
MICIAYTVALNRACTNTAAEFESRFNTRRVTIGYYELASDDLPNVSITHNSTKQRNKRLLQNLKKQTSKAI